MAAASYGEDQDGNEVGDSEARDGIFYGHAYSVLAAYEVNIKGKLTRLVKFRNPHGEGEWEGKYSDGDAAWADVSEEDKKKMEVSDEDDGVFFMEFENMRNYYEDCQVCQYRDNYFYEGIQVQSQLGEKEHFFEVVVPEQGFYYFQVNQKARAAYGEDAEYHYTRATCNVCDSEGNIVSACYGR